MSCRESADLCSVLYCATEQSSGHRVTGTVLFRMQRVNTITAPTDLAVDSARKHAQCPPLELHGLPALQCGMVHCVVSSAQPLLVWRRDSGRWQL